MIIENKFNIGDRVYVAHKGNVALETIVEIHIVDIEYRIKYIFKNGSYAYAPAVFALDDLAGADKLVEKFMQPYVPAEYLPFPKPFPIM